jgi:hypothetical protein
MLLECMCRCTVLCITFLSTSENIVDSEIGLLFVILVLYSGFTTDIL